ncbi:uncharacterized protein [Rutidosis leptorrhynchoides]|uniref:uncharacterized protein n=1 Tax=Rutidosis leptorrhynchoides TaxID=125765 RepID=UPI003A990EF3
MAILQMGNRHSGTISRGTRRREVFGRRYRLLHKVGRSQTAQNNFGQTDPQFCIKERLGLCRKGSIDELKNVLWVHRTTPKGATNETPFSLVYGSEAVIHAEINVPTMHILSFDESSNNDELRENLNLVKERREMAAIKEAINNQRIASYNNKHVQPLSFQLDDLVWRKNEENRAEDMGKLGPKWEGPYKVIGVSDTWAYRLASLDGKAIKRTWHAQTLKRCYI